MNASVRLLELAVPATAAVKVEVPETHPSAQILGTERLGTGVVVDAAAGLLLTVNYVVMGASSIEITLFDDTSLEGRVVAQDFASGLAVVAVAAQGLSALSLCPSTELRVGQDIFIVAAAGENKRRANDGAITSIAPFDAYWEYSLDRAITTTAMNPGLGGAPIFDSRGRIAGIVSLDLNEIGRFTLAIPVDDFLTHRDELLQHGRRVSRPARAWIGLYCYTFRDHVVIAGVLPATPGEQAGLKAGDVVLAVNGERITNRHELYTSLWTHRPGDVIEFRVFRNNEVKRVAVSSCDAEEFFA
jgi:S1-C subfamily serine protease